MTRYLIDETGKIIHSGPCAVAASILRTAHTNDVWDQFLRHGYELCSHCFPRAPAPPAEAAATVEEPPAPEVEPSAPEEPSTGETLVEDSSAVDEGQPRRRRSSPASPGDDLPE
jgi:hypothetical protein